MPAQSTIEVCPPEMLSAGDSAAQHLTEAAKPATNAAPTGGGGVALADIAAAALAAKVATHVGELSGKLVGKTPAVQTHTETGVAQLEQTDDTNAEMFRALGVEAQHTFSRLV